MDAEHLARTQAIVVATTGAIAATADLEAALRALFAGVRRLTGADYGGIRLPVIPGRPVGPCRVFFFAGDSDGTWHQWETLPGSSVARVMTSGRGEYSPDLQADARAGDEAARQAHAVRGLGSSLIVPLRGGGRIIGTLHADSRESRAFANEQLPPLQVLADHAGGAIEQVRLLAEATNRLRRLEVAQRVSKAANAATDLDDILRSVLQEAMALVTAPAGQVALVDLDREYVRGRVGLHLAPELVAATVRRLYVQADPDEDIYALVVRTGTQLTFGDDHPALHRSTRERFGHRGQRGVLTPIWHADSVIGVFAVVWGNEHDPDENDLAMLRLVAEQAGGAIARARLAEAERTQLQLLAAERARLAESEARFRDAFRHSASGMAIVAPNGRYMQVNAALCRMLGYSEAELLGTTFRAVTHPDDRAASEENVARLVRREIDHYTHEKRYLRKDGATVWVVLSVSLVRDPTGQHYFISQFQDITERKRAEAELAQQYQATDRLKDDFVSMVSHELRTPLTAIKGYVDILLDDGAGPLSAEQREFLTIVQDSTDREVALVNDLLDISRLEAGHVDLHLQRLDLPPLLRQVAATLRPQYQAKKQQVRLAFPSNVPSLAGDATRLTQVFTNLLGNAQKYTPAGGQITITVVVNEESLRVDVQDTGVGISSEEQEKIFTKFFRAQNCRTEEVGGSGLGLAITRVLVEQHGGRVTVSSVPDRGSTFSVTLPHFGVSTHLSSLPEASQR